MGTAGLAASGGAVLGSVIPAPAGSPVASVPRRPVFIAPPSGFAGYQVRSSVTEIAAHWSVPEIQSGSPRGSASTWIGVENVRGDFVQVGTLEAKFTDSSDPNYAAFWSDTSLGFHPQLLEAVQPGDRVAAEMTQTKAGWTLVIRDDSAGLNETFQTHYGGARTFDAGEWTQEDPAITLASIVDLPYPSLSSVRFSHLRLNRRRPRLSFSDGRSLASPNGVYLVPGHPVGDAFSLSPASPEQGQYLEDLRPLNFALEQFAAATLGFGQVPAAVAAVECESALETFRRNIEDQHWRPGVRRLVPALVRADAAVLRDVRAWNDHPSAEMRSRWIRDQVSTAAVSHRIRALLGLPPR